jgi:hypothetical protein
VLYPVELRAHTRSPLESGIYEPAAEPTQSRRSRQGWRSEPVASGARRDRPDRARIGRGAPLHARIPPFPDAAMQNPVNVNSLENKDDFLIYRVVLHFSMFRPPADVSRETFLRKSLSADFFTRLRIAGLGSPAPNARNWFASALVRRRCAADVSRETSLRKSPLQFFCGPANRRLRSCGKCPGPVVSAPVAV